MSVTVQRIGFVKSDMAEVYALAHRGWLPPSASISKRSYQMATNLNALRAEALNVLQIRSPVQKCEATAVLAISDCRAVSDEVFSEPAALPGRLERPALVPPGAVKHRFMHTVEGRATLIHSLAHIELNAVNLALDILWRFPDLPATFYTDWLPVAHDEARHFLLLRDHLLMLGFDYGDFPAHNGLWEMAEKTKGDLLARLALVPRTLEARGLDASPLIREKLKSAGDKRGAEILDIILQDEIGHVAIGNRWYRWACDARGVDPVSEYAVLAARYRAPALRGPFNIEARRAAGFTEEELLALNAAALTPKT